MKNPETPTDPNDWSPVELADAAQILHEVIPIAAMNNIPVAPLQRFKQYLQFLQLKKQKS